MSRMSKTIAILGVVAGLGVAALPLSSYAADGFTPATGDAPLSVDKVVPLQVEIDDYLEISTNRDSADAVVKLTKQGSAVDGAEYAATGFNVIVRSNATNGYTLSIKPTAAGNENMVNKDNDKIVPVTTAGTFNTTGSSWGYRVVLPTGGDAITGAATTADQWTGLGTGTSTILTQTDLDTETTTDTGRSINVQFGAKVAGNQPAGVYETSVTFTATNAVDTAA